MVRSRLRRSHHHGRRLNFSKRVIRTSIERASAPDLDGRSIRWGRVYDIQDLAQREEEAVKVAAYVAKYAAKTTDGSKELARRFRSRRQIVSLVDDPHLRRLALTAWDLGGEAKYESMRLREHAHTFGFTGQLITKSRAFSTTFEALRSARTDFMAGERDGDPVEGTFPLRRSWIRRPSRDAARRVLLHVRSANSAKRRGQGNALWSQQAGDAVARLSPMARDSSRIRDRWTVVQKASDRISRLTE